MYKPASEELRLMAESVDRFLATEYDFSKRPKYLAEPHGFSQYHWKEFAELGWLGIALPERAGGFDGGIAAAAALVDRFGAHLLVSPYLSSIMMGANLLHRCASDSQIETWVHPVVAGESHLSLAVAEEHAQYDLRAVRTRAQRDADGFALTGTKCGVLFGALANNFIVSARIEGAHDGIGDIGLFVVPQRSIGLTVRSYRTHDGGAAAQVTLDGVRVGADRLVAHGVEAIDALERVSDEVSVLICADSLGSMWTSYETTLEYLKVREQFRAKLGSFQALQHRMVEVFMQCELAQSITERAIQGCAPEADEAALPKLASAARYKVSKAARQTCQESIQMHGGMGMMEEVTVGHHLKRVTVMNSMLGDARWHLRRYATLASPDG